MPTRAAFLLLGALVSALPARSAELLTNPGFDGGAAGWDLFAEAGRYEGRWQAVDAGGDVGSGSILLEHHGDLVDVSYSGALQCVPVDPGATYDVAATLRLPPGQPVTGSVRVVVYWSSGSDCTGFLSGVTALLHDAPGGWVPLAASVVAPAGAHSARVRLNIHNTTGGATLVGHVDDVSFDDGSVAADPTPPYGSWLRDDDLAGFEAQVRITPVGGASIQGSREPACIPEAICARGALAGRPEIFLKVIGPRPNGFLWAQLARFTPSQVEVWLRRIGSGAVNYYLLPPTQVDDPSLPGIEDREAFVP